MRTKQAVKNLISSFISYIFVSLMAFVVQRVFKDALGKEYLGINGLYANIMSGLGIIELGFGAAIIANMYKPVAEQNIPVINALIQFYKKIYRVVAAIVFGVGLCILPFVDLIIGETVSLINAKLIFLFYLADAVFSNFLTYKRSMLYANQQAYYMTWIHTAVMTATYLGQILVLIVTGNYYVFLVINILSRLLENIIINILVNKLYPYLLMGKEEPLDNETKRDIKKKVHGLIFHKIASFVVFGTDNIIISVVPGLGIIWVGVYSSYSMITRKLKELIGTALETLTASVGNLLVENQEEKSYEMFRNIYFFSGWVYAVAGISFYFLSFPFVELWMGKDFVLDDITVFVIMLNFFLGGMRVPFGVFKNAAGIFYEDRFIPVIEALVNLVVSIALAAVLGLKGVLIGTICSDLVLYLYSFPRYVYQTVLKKQVAIYIKDLLRSFVQFVVAFIVTALVMSLLRVNGVWMKLLVTAVGCLTVPNMVLILLNIGSKELWYYLELGQRFFRRRL